MSEGWPASHGTAGNEHTLEEAELQAHKSTHNNKYEPEDRRTFIPWSVELVAFPGQNLLVLLHLLLLLVSPLLIHNRLALCTMTAPAGVPPVVSVTTVVGELIVLAMEAIFAHGSRARLSHKNTLRWVLDPRLSRW